MFKKYVTITGCLQLKLIYSKMQSTNMDEGIEEY